MGLAFWGGGPALEITRSGESAPQLGLACSQTGGMGGPGAGGLGTLEMSDLRGRRWPGVGGKSC